MVSVFLVNDSPLGIKNPSFVDVSINGYNSDAGRSDSGDLTVLNKINSIAKISVGWDYLTIADMETLCNTFNIDVSDFGEAYPVKAIDELVFKITTRIPSGVRSFSAYVGDTISSTLHDNSGNLNQHNIGGEYWSNVKLSLIGTGEGWNL